MTIGLSNKEKPPLACGKRRLGLATTARVASVGRKWADNLRSGWGEGCW